MTRWRDSVMNTLVDALKVSVRACLLIDGILLGVFSVWFVAMAVLRLMDWLGATLFATS